MNEQPSSEGARDENTQTRERPLVHVCEVCDLTETLLPSQAFDAGWDYPPRMGGGFGTVSPRTCPTCSIHDTLWWEIAINHTPTADLSDRHQTTLARILGEPETILPPPPRPLIQETPHREQPLQGRRTHHPDGRLLSPSGHIAAGLTSNHVGLYAASLVVIVGAVLNLFAAVAELGKSTPAWAVSAGELGAPVAFAGGILVLAAAIRLSMHSSRLASDVRAAGYTDTGEYYRSMLRDRTSHQ